MNKTLIKPKLANEVSLLKFTEDRFLGLVEKSIIYNDSEYRHIEIESILKIKNDNLTEEFANYKKYVFDTLHEVRSLNNTLSSRSDDILSISRKYLTGEDDFFRHGVHSILATSGFISSRLSALDILVNPSVLEKSITKPGHIYSKMYKCKQILSTYFADYKIGISLTGESYSTALINDLFEMCPYLIFENYLKYSPRNTTINAHFSEDDKNIYVKIANEGPVHSDSEIKKIFDLNYRNPNVSSTKGSGVGLYIVRLVFDYLKFEISTESDKTITRTISGIQYSNFITNIRIPILHKLSSRDDEVNN